MKRFSLILLSLLLIEACAGSFAEEAPWVTMENVREHSGYVWREEIPHYNGAEEQGFQPLAMDPAEAWQRLRDAYDRGQDEATCELLQSWGIEMEPCGAPVLRELISQADLQHQGHSDVSTENVPLVQLISFSGWGWGEEGTLIFVEQWPNWYLWDYIPFSCEDFRLCGTDDGTGVYLEFGVIGHGMCIICRCEKSRQAIQPTDTKSFRIQAFRYTARPAMPGMVCTFSGSFRRWCSMKHRTNLCRQAPFWTYLITASANRDIWSGESK